MSEGWTNQSFRHIDLAGPEPEWDPRALDCWTRYFAWDRRRTNVCCFSRCRIGAEGLVSYEPVLRSERTRARRLGVRHAAV